MMEKYLNRNGNSPITHFEIFEGKITVWFGSTAGSYTYSYKKAGKANVEQMKVLARNGVGLCSFINRTVKKLYD